ncbi:CRISPR-associated endonuclease Cas2 [Oceanotoga teriensis]|uniref:CRISPR-associated endoribonuclease Cas2 n=1 Tax=Oceanotoga teriensis TaxID=515440 RepID=A0AA45HHW1_9BACT|nr:CRISPR-associated endonuclease Cas2 [Oceanotoga teriensis]MDO7976433.1 CRISPR-associated endonuclease Cas2 [Oceanotoga teriensis]PWJ88995.1 CRISPR-associated Cas2 family protein [Oceanotoga teriensis]
MYIILIYDINIEEDNKKGQRILNNSFKICKKYLNHVQKSVFEGEIDKAQLEKLHSELNRYIRKDLDSIIVFKSNNPRWLMKDFWGIKEDKTSNFF